MNLRVILFLLAVVVLILCVTGAKIKNKNMQKLIKCSVPLVLFTALILCMSKNVEPYCAAPDMTTFDALPQDSKEKVNANSPINENNMGFGPTNLTGYETSLSNWMGSECNGTSEYWRGDDTTAAISTGGFKSGISAPAATIQTCRDACGQVSKRDKIGDGSQFYELNAEFDGEPTNAAECILAVGGDNSIFTPRNFGPRAQRDYTRFTPDGGTTLRPDQGRVILNHICDKMDGAPSEEDRRCLGLDLSTSQGDEGYEKSCPGLWLAFENAVADETPDTCGSVNYDCTGAVGARNDANVCEDPPGTSVSCDANLCCTQPRTCADPTGSGTPFACSTGGTPNPMAPCVDAATGSLAFCNDTMCCNTGALVPTLEIDLVDKIVYNSVDGVYESSVDSTITNLPFQEELNVFKVFVVLPDDRAAYENMTEFTTDSEFKFPEIILPNRHLYTTFAASLTIPPGYPPKVNYIDSPSVVRDTMANSVIASDSSLTDEEAHGVVRGYLYESYVTITNTVTELDSALVEFPMKFDYQPLQYRSAINISMYSMQLYPNTTSINIPATTRGGPPQVILSHNPGISPATGEVSYASGTSMAEYLTTAPSQVISAPRRILVAQLVMPLGGSPDNQIKFTAGGNITFGGGGGEWKQTLDSEEGGTPISLTNRFDGTTTTADPWYMG